jgi:hypothetical protein
MSITAYNHIQRCQCAIFNSIIDVMSIEDPLLFGFLEYKNFHKLIEV